MTVKTHEMFGGSKYLQVTVQCLRVLSVYVCVCMYACMYVCIHLFENDMFAYDLSYVQMLIGVWNAARHRGKSSLRHGLGVDWPQQVVGPQLV